MTHHVAAPHALPPYWWGSVRLQVGVADLTCARSVVRHLVPFVHPVDRSRRFGHVSGLAVRRGGTIDLKGFLPLEKLQAVFVVQVSAPKLLVVLVVCVAPVGGWSSLADELLRRANDHVVARTEEGCHRHPFLVRVDDSSMANAVVPTVT
ncbi:hypothetical protein GW17_00052740 [Ensete ventricosum]|nr:hypothetical protein GW17_00052740 [Ensete ventricosum]